MKQTSPGRIGWPVLIGLVAIPLVAALAAWQLQWFEPRTARLVRTMQTAKRPEDRAAAARKLGKMGPAARPAAPALVAALKDDERYVTQTLVIFPQEHYVKYDAFNALKLIGGPETVEALADALVETSRRVKRGELNWDWRLNGMQAQLLAELGPESLPAAERLLETIDGCNQGHVIEHAVRALAAMNLPPDSPAAEKARVILPQFCFHSNGVGRIAATVLHRLYPDDDEMLELYVRAMLSGTPPVGPGAVPMDAKTVPLVIQGFADGTRRSALNQLGAAKLSQVLEPLRLALGDPEPRIRSGAATALAARGPAAAEAELELAKLLTDEDPEVRVAAATALWCCARQVESSLPVLAAALDSEHASAKDAARAFLQSRNHDDAWAAPALLKLISVDTDKPQRLAALSVLAQIGSGASEFSSDLLKHLKDEDADIQRAAAKAVASLERMPP